MEDIVSKTVILVACIAFSYLVISTVFPKGFGARVKSLFTWKKRGSLQPVEAAAYFAALRDHFATTDQPGRVTVMDDDLAAGVFTTEHLPVVDITPGESTDA